jgi:hypothetical protein
VFLFEEGIHICIYPGKKIDGSDHVKKNKTITKDINTRHA